MCLALWLPDGAEIYNLFDKDIDVASYSYVLDGRRYIRNYL